MSIHIVANVLTVIMRPRAESYQLQLYWRGLEKANLLCGSMWVCSALTLACLCGAHGAQFDTNRSSFSRHCSFHDSVKISLSRQSPECSAPEVAHVGIYLGEARERNIPVRPSGYRCTTSTGLLPMAKKTAS